MLNAPQFTAAVVNVRDGDGPTVFVDVEAALGVDVTLAWFEGGFYDPDTVFLIAGHVRIHIARLEQIIVGFILVHQFEGIVRN
ncbi:hypothetical protein D3C77_595280 [compost metagenome]